MSHMEPPEHRPEKLPPLAAAMFSRGTHRWLSRVDQFAGRLQRLGFLRSARPTTALHALRPKRLLVLESHVLGDLVMTAPLLDRLRARYGDAEITLAAHAPAAALHGVRRLVDHIIALPMVWQAGGGSPRAIRRFARAITELRRSQFELAVSPWGDLRDALILRLIGAKRRLAPVYGGGYFFLTDGVPLPAGASHLADLRSALLRALGEDVDACPLSHPRLAIEPALIDCDAAADVVIHPGSSRPDKTWPVTECATAVRRMVERRLRVTVVGTAAEETRLIAIRDAVGKDERGDARVRLALPTLDELASLLASARVAVTMDSAASHLAAAVGTPVVVLFGPTTPENCGARGDAPVRYLRSPNGAVAGIATHNVVSAVDELLAVDDVVQPRRHSAPC